MGVESPEASVDEPEAPKVTSVEHTPEPETARVEMPPEKALSPTKHYEAERRAARIARWEKVRDLRQAGASIRQIPREVGMCQLLRDRDLVALDGWLHDVQGSDIPTFMGLANGIQADRSAVEAAFRLPWSNGQLEGHVNRVKPIKRQGYGRAKSSISCGAGSC